MGVRSWSRRLAGMAVKQRVASFGEPTRHEGDHRPPGGPRLTRQDHRKGGAFQTDARAVNAIQLSRRADLFLRSIGEDWRPTALESRFRHHAIRRVRPAL